MGNFYTNVKTWGSNTYNKAKDGISRTYNTAKQKAKNYSEVVNNAYNSGYNAGWRDADVVPSDYFSRVWATSGYGRGLRNSHRVKKYSQRIKQND